jgi:predicted DNA-binding protein with PD1-like motif
MNTETRKQGILMKVRLTKNREWETSFEDHVHAKSIDVVSELIHTLKNSKLTETNSEKQRQQNINRAYAALDRLQRIEL